MKIYDMEADDDFSMRPEFKNASCGSGFLGGGELKRMGFKSVGVNTKIGWPSTIIGAQNITVGNNVRIDQFCTIIATEPITIGSHIHIGAYCFLLGPIRIEDFAGLSQRVSLYGKTDDFSGAGLVGPIIPNHLRKVHSGGVALCRHALLGSGTIVLPNVIIRQGTSVGAASLIRKDLDSWKMYAGNPARKIGDRDRETILKLERQFLEERHA